MNSFNSSTETEIFSRNPNPWNIIANCKCKLASAGEDSWRKGFSEFQLKKAKQYEPCEHA